MKASGPTISPPSRCRALLERTGLDGAEGRRRLPRLRQPGRRGQPQRRAHGGAARRAARVGARRRPSTGCAAPGSRRSTRPRGMIRLGEADVVHRRRRRVDDPRAVGRCPSRDERLPHAASASSSTRRSAGASRTRSCAALFPLERWARPPRTSPRSGRISREEQDAFALALAPAARSPRSEAGGFADEIVPVEIPQRKGARRSSSRGRGPARRHHAREARRAEARVPRRRHGDRRQLVDAQRRRGGGAASMSDERREGSG